MYLAKICDLLLKHGSILVIFSIPVNILPKCVAQREVKVDLGEKSTCLIFFIFKEQIALVTLGVQKIPPFVHISLG
jgi:energy-converting hydrogenase Eha subunit E